MSRTTRQLRCHLTGTRSPIDNELLFTRINKTNEFGMNLMFKTSDRYVIGTEIGAKLGLRVIDIIVYN